MSNLILCLKSAVFGAEFEVKYRNRGAGFGALAMVRYYARIWRVLEAAVHNYFRGHNNEPPLVHRTPRDFSRSCGILPRVSSQNSTLGGTV